MTKGKPKIKKLRTKQAQSFHQNQIKTRSFLAVYLAWSQVAITHHG
jgi:hypothetical protein